jgi:hypothetical protein
MRVGEGRNGNGEKGLPGNDGLNGEEPMRVGDGLNGNGEMLMRGKDGRPELRPEPRDREKDLGDIRWFLKKFPPYKMPGGFTDEYISRVLKIPLEELRRLAAEESIDLDPPPPPVLSPPLRLEEELEILGRWASGDPAAPSPRPGGKGPDLPLRARIVLKCLGGAGDRAVARQVGVCEPEVTRLRLRHARRGSEGLREAAGFPGEGALRGGRDHRAIVRLLASPPAGGASGWSCASLARVSGIPAWKVRMALVREGVAEDAGP